MKNKVILLICLVAVSIAQTPDAIARHANLTKADASRVLESITQTIQGVLKSGDSVALVGFGTFVIKERGERVGRNPKTGEAITISAAKLPTFKAGRALKDAVH